MILLLEDFKIYGGQEVYGLRLASFLYSKYSDVFVGRTTRATCILRDKALSQHVYGTQSYTSLVYLILNNTRFIFRKAKRVNSNQAITLITSTFLIGIYFGIVSTVYHSKLKVIYISHLTRKDHTMNLGCTKKLLFNIHDTIIGMTTTRVCISNHIYEYYKKLPFQKNVMCINNPVPTIPESGTSLSCLSESPNNEYDLAFIGRLSKEKGIPYLCKLLQALVHKDAEIRVVIFGEGPDRRLVEELALQHPNNINYRGFVDNPHLSVKSKVILFPSLYEGLSLSFLEAIAQGFLPLTTKIPGFDSYLGEQYPYLTLKVNDDTDKINYILKNPHSNMIRFMRNRLKSCMDGILSQEVWESRWLNLLSN
jgi:glycosyltransferase involved in cell wall biosynthesis